MQSRSSERCTTWRRGWSNSSVDAADDAGGGQHLARRLAEPLDAAREHQPHTFGHLDLIGAQDRWLKRWRLRLKHCYLNETSELPHSVRDSIRDTAAKHFAGVPDLLLVAVPAAAILDAIKWEPSRGGDLFPHLYRPLPVFAASWVKPLGTGADGRHLFPEL